MLTIKLFLAESGSVATMDKDFPLYRGQFQNILLNVFVPLSTLAPDFTLSTDSGQYDGLNTPYVAGTTVSVACQTVKRNGTIATSKSYNLRFVKNITKNGIGYALFERKLPKEFTTYAGVAPAGLTMICNVTNVSYGQIDQEQTKATSARGAVTIDFVALTKQVPAVTQNYTFTYDTAETPASWYLYGDKVDLATYGLSIAWTPANGNTISLAVVASDPSTISVLTTQTVKYDVFPSSDLDEDTPEDTSALQELQAQVNSATARITDVVIGLSAKQNIYDDTLKTQSKTVPTAINELDTKVTGLGTRVDKNEQDISDLEQTVITGITYVGSFSYAGDGEPTDNQLNNFVIGTKKRTPIGGDFVLAVRKIPDATDIIYACIYSSASAKWGIAPIPGLELASNDNAGLIQGGDSGDGKLYVNIVGGVIKDITAKTGEAYPAVSVKNLSKMYADIAQIISGDIAVGKATMAAMDAKGNTIDTYYMPNSIGATKNFVRQYALPVEFNDALYVSTDGLVKDIPATPSTGIQFTASSSATGYTDLFTVAYNLNNDGGTKFQLSRKNSFNADLFVRANNQEEVQFVVDMSAGSDPAGGSGNTTLATVVTTGNVVSPALSAISISSLFADLEDEILTLDGTQGNVYIVAKVQVFRTSSSAQTYSVICNSMYPSCFHLSTAFQTIAVTTGKVGELPQMIFTGYTVNGSDIIFTPETVVPPDNSVVHVILPSVPDADKGKTVLLSIGGEDVPINTPNGNNATVEDLYPSLKYSDSGAIGYDFIMSYTAQNGVGEYYVQQGYEKSVTNVKFPDGTHDSITYDTADGLTIKGQGKIDYKGKSDTPDMSVSIPLKAGNGISMDADTTNKYLVIKATETANWSEVSSTSVSLPTSADKWVVQVSRQGDVGERVVYSINDHPSDFFTTNLPVVFTDKEGAIVPLLLISSATYPVYSFDLKQFTDADGTIRIYAIRTNAGHILFNTGAFVSSSPRLDAESGGDITEIQIGDFKYTLNKGAIDKCVQKATTTSGDYLYGRSNSSETQYVLSSDKTAYTVAQRGAKGELKATTVAATSENADCVATIGNVVDTNNAVAAKVDKVTTSADTKSYAYCYKALVDNGPTSPVYYAVERDSPTSDTIPRRRPDASILARKSTAQTTSAEWKQACVVNAQLENTLSGYVSGTASADGTANTVALRDADGALKAATKDATSANAEYVATISNVVVTNGAVTAVSNRVTTLEGKKLYRHDISGSSTAGGLFYTTLYSYRSSAITTLADLLTVVGTGKTLMATGSYYEEGAEHAGYSISVSSSSITLSCTGGYSTTFTAFKDMVQEVS